MSFDEAASSRRVAALLSEDDVREVRRALPMIRKRAAAAASASNAVRTTPLTRALAADLSMDEAVRLLREAAVDLKCNEGTPRIVAGLACSVENPKWSVRTGTSRSGRSWAVVMPADYGYVRNVDGADGDELDAFFGEAEWSPTVWVADMKDPETGEWDEHKCFLGFENEEAVREVLRAAYDDGAQDRVAGLTEMGLDEFTAWVREHGRKDEPLTAANQTSAKRHVIPDFRERMAQLRKARHRDFDPILDRLAHIGTMRTASEMKAAVDELIRELPKLGDEAMRGGRSAQVVAEMLMSSFMRSLADGGNPKRIIRR